jgi:hypothetical protein
MRLNKIDCKIIVKQENSKWYIHNILKNDFDAGGEPLYNYIVYNNLYNEIGMSENELDLYEPQIGLGLFREYLSDEPNNSKNPKQKQMYDMFMNIAMNGNPDRILMVIYAYADIKNEIPEDILIRYMDKVHDISIRFLCNNLLSHMVPPVILLKRLKKSKREYPLFVKYISDNILDRGGNEKLRDNIRATWKILNSLSEDDSVKTESFKSFFYKNIV